MKPRPDKTDYTKWPEVYLARESAHGDIGNGHWLIRYSNVKIKGDTANDKTKEGECMNLNKKYHDTNGNECNILQLIEKEPEWAAHRIQAGEKYRKMLDKLIDTIDCVFPCEIECRPSLKKCRKCVKDWLQREIKLEEGV